MRIGIRIDTGGTCTDAVAYDYDTNTLLAKGKALTTKENLAVGISNALDKLPAEYVRNANIVALSTTLATNACVEIFSVVTEETSDGFCPAIFPAIFAR